MYRHFSHSFSFVCLFFVHCILFLRVSLCCFYSFKSIQCHNIFFLNNNLWLASTYAPISNSEILNCSKSMKQIQFCTTRAQNEKCLILFQQQLDSFDPCLHTFDKPPLFCALFDICSLNSKNPFSSPINDKKDSIFFSVI